MSVEKVADQEVADEENPEEDLEGVELIPSEIVFEPNDPRQYSSNYYLNKHTDSFKCFEQYLCSQSDLRLTLSFFEPLTDPGLDAALNYVAPEDPPDNTGVEKYKRLCKEAEIVPISRIIKSLTTDTLNLKYYGLTLNQMKALAEALKVNGDVKHLILQDNWMCPDAATLIGDILRENNAIRILNLQECRIGEEGAERLSEGISLSQFLQELDLSFNNLGDKGLKLLQSSIIENTSIKKLNISHNNLTEDSGETLEKILLENKCLEQLDLSWNGFCSGPGNKKLCNGLKHNEFIKWLSLAWNGIATRPSMVPIARYVKKATTLEHLDLSWNSITAGSFRSIRGALAKNMSLIEVKLGNNIYTPDEAFVLGSVLMTAKNNLTSLDMENMCVNKDFLPIAQRIRKMGKVVTYGKVLSNYIIRGPNINHLLFRRCNYLAMKPKKKKAKKDFGHFVLSLPDSKVTTQDFQTLLKKKKVKKIDKDLLGELMKKFPARGQKVDCVEMKNAYMELYPDTVLPEPPPKKKKGKKGRKKKKKKPE